jgi:hypothetical protein
MKDGVGVGKAKGRFGQLGFCNAVVVTVTNINTVQEVKGFVLMEVVLVLN